MTQEIGKRIIDISGIVQLFDMPEGIVEQITGSIGQGKTYEANRRAWDYLCKGYVVYTTWKMILPDVYDERENIAPLLWKSLFFQKQFYAFDFTKNWHYLDIFRPDLKQFVAKLTDCIVMLDEGQDIFDSHERSDKGGRQTLTRTRHLKKTLIIISQRAQAVDVTARAIVQSFYRCEKLRVLFWNYFRVYTTEEVDNNNYPIFSNEITGWQAPIYHSGFGKKRVYALFNSWYLREGIEKSQDVHFAAYNLDFFERSVALFRTIWTGISKGKNGPTLARKPEIVKEKVGITCGQSADIIVDKPEVPVVQLSNEPKQADGDGLSLQLHGEKRGEEEASASKASPKVGRKKQKPILAPALYHVPVVSLEP